VSASVEGLSGGVNENGTAGAEDGQAWSGRVSVHVANRHGVLARCGGQCDGGGTHGGGVERG
jgi:hypothetical protein